jgi:phosphoglucomutase
VSITQAQIDAVNKQTGNNLDEIRVKLSYFVSGSVAATNGFAGSDFFL